LPSAHTPPEESSEESEELESRGKSEEVREEEESELLEDSFMKGLLSEDESEVYSSCPCTKTQRATANKAIIKSFFIKTKNM